MAKGIKIWVGMDVHKEKIAICWLLGDSQKEEEREILNDETAIRKFFKRLSTEGEIRACYEAGPCGYAVRRQLEGMRVDCQVIAPSLIPKRAGDKVKNDRRDARKLARLYRAGELTTIRVPTQDEEAVRDLLRCREDLSEQIQRNRQHVLKFLLRHGRVWRQSKNWSQLHWQWLRAQRFELPAAQRTLDEYLAQLDYSLERMKQMTAEIEAIAKREPWKSAVSRLRCLRGIQTLSAMILLAELQDFRRFESPRQLMNFLGLTPGLHASGGKGYTLSITKTGNSHARRILVEAAWQYRSRPQQAAAVRRRCEGQPPSVVTQARNAQDRLHYRFKSLVEAGKKRHVAVVAVARELAGFAWALMTKPDPSATDSASASKSQRHQ